MKIILVAGALVLGSASLAQVSGDAGADWTNEVAESCSSMPEAGAGKCDQHVQAGAMGGPYEPTEVHALSTTEGAPGAPIEERPGYPPCINGELEDSCVQPQ